MGRVVESKKHYDESFLIQKIWGCFADVVSYKRYESFAGSNDSTHFIFDSLSESEINKVYSNLEKTFKLKMKVEMTKRDTFKRFVTKVKRFVRENGY